MSRRGDYLPLFERDESQLESNTPLLGAVPGLRSDLFQQTNPPVHIERRNEQFQTRAGPSSGYQSEAPAAAPRTTNAANLTGANPEDSFVVADGNAHTSQSIGNFSTNSRWDHVKDLDQFFTRIYDYHQSGGFKAIVLTEILELFQFAFIVLFCVFMTHCVNYDKLFGRDLNISLKKVTISDVLCASCPGPMSVFTVGLLLCAFTFWVGRLAKAVVRITHMWDMSVFYERALRIPRDQIEGGAHNGSVTWHFVLSRLCQVQSELQLCIHKRDLTELDIVQRILRHTNYFVALVNHSETMHLGIPPKLNVSTILGPNVAPFAFFSDGLLLNLELLLFHGAGAPWENSFTLRNEYKSSSGEFRHYHLHALSVELERRCLWLGVANLVLMPLVFVWRVLLALMQAAELAKRRPHALALRKWSLFARFYLRHFNELEHELMGRLNLAHKPATTYMGMFGSGVVTEILARNIALVAGAIFGVLLALGAWQEDVFEVDHLLTVMTGCGLLIYVCGAFIPDDNLVWCPEVTLQTVATHVHYLPTKCTGAAHTEQVRSEFSNLFPYKLYLFAEEVLSPIVTPLVLIFGIRPNASKIVEFFYKSTISVPGAGDMCSFSLMDLKSNGDRKYQRFADGETNDQNGTADEKVANDLDLAGVQNDPMTKTTNGKVEMSLIRFAGANPNWKPTKVYDQQFLDTLKSKALHGANTLSVQCNAITVQQMYDSGDAACAAMAQSVAPLVAGFPLLQHAAFEPSAHGVLPGGRAPFAAAADEAPDQQNDGADSLLASLHQSGFLAPRFQSRYALRGAALSDQALAGTNLETSVHLMFLRHMVAHQQDGTDDDVPMRNVNHVIGYDSLT